MFEANTRLNIFWVINYTVKPPSVYNSPQIYINSCRFFKYLQVFTRNLDEKPEIKNTCRFFEYLQVFTEDKQWYSTTVLTGCCQDNGCKNEERHW